MINNSQIAILGFVIFMFGFFVAMLFVSFFLKNKKEDLGNWHLHEHKILFEKLHELMSDYAGVHGMPISDVGRMQVGVLYQWAKINFRTINHYDPHPTFKRKDIKK